MTIQTVPFFFIVGCPRSGTTLLQRIVNAHSQIAVVPEIFWITHYVNTRSGPRLDDPITPEIVRALIEHKRFRELEIPQITFENLLDCERPLSCGQFLTKLFEVYRLSKGKQFVGNKTPQYVQNIPTFHAQWPQTKFVHIIRDGRDVCLSVLNWKKADRTAGRFNTWADDPVSTTALWWKRNVLLGREAGNLLGAQLYFEIQYEALVLRPQEECVRLCAFLGVPYDDRIIQHHKERPSTDVHLNAKSWTPITQGMRDWKSQMRPEDVARFEAAAGDLLSELGYNRAFERPSTERITHAAKIYAMFTQEVQMSRKLLPQQW